MEEDIKFVRQIGEYDAMVGAETLHPLINVVDFSKLPPMRNIAVKRLFGYYAVYLKGHKDYELRYGRDTYQYGEGELVFVAPGQVMGVEDDGVVRQITTRVLMFHPDLLHGTFLQPFMSQYTFFSYNTHEALTPTETERLFIITIFERIESELRCFEESSMPVLLDYVKLVLDYCLRIYHRKFVDSRPQNLDFLARLEDLLDAYFQSDAPRTKGIPTVNYCAERFCLSANYFSDLVRTATGMSAQKTIYVKMLEVAKERLSHSDKRVNEVATEMGFQQPQSFNTWFKRLEGCTPLQYQKALMEKNL